MEKNAVGGVSMSADGTRISFLIEPDLDGSSIYYQRATPIVLEHNDNGTNWTVVGDFTHVRMIPPTYGVEVASTISGDGQQVAGRSSYDNAWVYANCINDDKKWIKLGQGLPCRSSPLLSHDGKRAACYGIKNDMTDNTKYVDTFELIGDEWINTGRWEIWDGDVCRPLRYMSNVCNGSGYSGFGYSTM